MSEHDTCRRAAELSVTQRGTGRKRRRTRPLARPDIDVVIDFDSEHNFYAGVGRNVAAGGLFLRTPILWPPGTRLRVRFQLSGLPDPTELDAVVHWVLDVGEIEGHGMGVQLLEVPAPIRAAIESFASKREPLLHEIG